MLLIIIYVPHYKHICPILTFGLGDYNIFILNSLYNRTVVTNPWFCSIKFSTIKNHLDYQSSNNIHMWPSNFHNKTTLD